MLSAGHISLCEWLFRGALTCAGAWGKCHQHPAQDLEEHLGCHWKHVGPVGAVEKLMSPCWGHLELEVSPSIAVSSCQGLDKVKK